MEARSICSDALFPSNSWHISQQTLSSDTIIDDWNRGTAKYGQTLKNLLAQIETYKLFIQLELFIVIVKKEIVELYHQLPLFLPIYFPKLKGVLFQHNLKSSLCYANNQRRTKLIISKII